MVEVGTLSVELARLLDAITDIEHVGVTCIMASRSDVWWSFNVLDSAAMLWC